MKLFFEFIYLFRPLMEAGMPVVRPLELYVGGLSIYYANLILLSYDTK